MGVSHDSSNLEILIRCLFFLYKGLFIYMDLLNGRICTSVVYGFVSSSDAALVCDCAWWSGFVFPFSVEKGHGQCDHSQN